MYLGEDIYSEYQGIVATYSVVLLVDLEVCYCYILLFTTAQVICVEITVHTVYTQWQRYFGFPNSLPLLCLCCRVGLTGTRTECSTTKVGGHWERTGCGAGQTKTHTYQLF